MENFLWPAILYIATFILSIPIGKKLNIPKELTIKLYLWHNAFTIIYFIVTKFKPSDTVVYFEAGKNPDWILQPGTSFINYISGILVSILGMDIFSTFITVGFLGYVAILFLANIYLIHIPRLFQNKINQNNISYMILFLPSLSFWSSFLGKDAIALLGCSLSLYGIVEMNKRLIFFTSGILLMYSVRPHAAAFMIISLIISLLMSTKIKTSTRLIIATISTLLLISLSPIILNYVGLSANSNEKEVSEYIEKMQGLAEEGGTGAIQLAEMPIPLRLFSYLFRPLFIDARNIEQMIGSFENLFLLFIFVKYFKYFYKTLIMDKNLLIRYSGIYSLISLFVFGNTAYNIGIAFRQKTMFLPALFLIIVYAYTKKYSNYENRKQIVS